MPERTSLVEPRHLISSLFLAALCRVLLVWMSAAAVMFVVALLVDGDWIGGALVIATASALISILALLPGILLRDQPKTASGRTYLFMIGCVAAMAIRVVGTVALLVACRYQLSLPIQTTAMFVCGWYVLLTSIEVSSLARSTQTLACHSSELVTSSVRRVDATTVHRSNN